MSLDDEDISDIAKISNFETNKRDVRVHSLNLPNKERPPSYSPVNRSKSISLASLPNEREKHFTEMNEIFEEYVGYCDELYSWIVPKEVMKNTGRFSILSPSTWSKKNRKGIRHREVTDDVGFVEAISKLQPLLSRYASFCMTLIDMIEWNLSSSIFSQLNWFEENDNMLENISKSMDEKISEKMSETNRRNLKKSINQCRQTLSKIKTYASLLRKR